MKLCMTDEEIRTSWRNAADPTNHVQVLADLNAVEEREMEKYLESLGIDTGKKSKLSAIPPQQEEKIKALYEKGLPDDEIAKRLVTVSKYRIAQWRQKHNLPINDTRAIPVDIQKRMRELYNEGMQDPDIARMTGVAQWRVRHWRLKNDLPGYVVRSASTTKMWAAKKRSENKE